MRRSTATGRMRKSAGTGSWPGSTRNGRRSRRRRRPGKKRTGRPWRTRRRASGIWTGIDGDFRVKEAARTHGAEEMERLAGAIAAHGKAAEQAAAELADAETERQAADAALVRERQAADAADAEKAAAAERLTAGEAAHRQRLDAVREKTLRKERLESALRREEEETERQAAALGEAVAAEKAARKDAETAEAALRALDEKTADRTARMAGLEAEGKDRRAALEAGETRHFQLMQRESEAKNRASQLAAQRAYLAKAEKEYASFSNASRTVLTADMPWQSHIRGAFGELLRVPGAYAGAAEAALGGTVSYIVTDTAEAAEAIIRWMKEKNAGRTTFYPLDAMKPRFSDALEREAAREEGVRGIASDLFGCAPGIEALKQALLGRVLIVEDLAAARRIAKKYKYRLHLVTLDGQILRPGGSMTGGSMKKKANTFFGRKQEMEELARGEAAAREEAEHIARALAAQAETNAALSEALSASREAWQALHVENAAAAGRREGLASALSAAQAAASAASVARAAAEAARKTHEEQASALRKERDALGDIPALPEEAELAALRAAADRAAQDAANQRVALARAEEALRRADDQVKAKAAAADAEQTGRKQAEDALEKRRGEDAAMAEALAALSAQYDRAKAAQQAAADARDRRAGRGGSDRPRAERVRQSPPGGAGCGGRAG